MKLSKSIVPVAISIVVSFYVIQCQEKEPDPSTNPILPVGCDGDVAGTDCRFFSVPEDSTFTYSSGTEIVAKEGMELNGNILIKPDREGDFTLTVLEGDIILAGTIAYDTTFSPNNGGRVAAGEDGQKGNSIIINAKNGNVIVKSTHTIVAFDGGPATDKLLTSTLFANTDSGFVAGGNGGNGGDILLNAINGAITLPIASEIPEKHTLFRPGIGGNGGSVILDGDEFVVNEEVTSFYAKGGDGGNSGKVLLVTGQINGGWTMRDLENWEFFFIDAGAGGRGGNAYWFTYRLIPQKTNLESIYFEGGKGGDGIIYGGKGGFAACNLASAIINEIGSKITAVYVSGGDGGNVVGSGGLSMHKVYGGDGGEFLAHGAKGWYGGKEPNSDIFHKNGADGGSVTAKGGNGGDVENSVRAYSANGGNGAMSDVAGILFVDELIQLLDLPSSSHEDLFFGVLGGNGGDGANTCLTENGGPGGNGGSIGTYSVYGGDGGLSEANAILKKQGNGGDIWRYGAMFHGNGGDGQPGGNGGSGDAKGEVVPGNGKEKGKVLFSQTAPENGEDGKACTESCGIGGIQTGYYEARKRFGNDWYISKYSSIVRITSGSSSEWIYMKKEITETDGQIYTQEWHKGDENPPLNDDQFLWPFQPRCTSGGSAYMPGDGNTIINQDEDELYILGSTGCFIGWEGVNCTCGGNLGGTLECN